MRVRYRWVVTQPFNQDALHVFLMKYVLEPGGSASFVFSEDHWVEVDYNDINQGLRPTLTFWGVDMARADENIFQVFEDAWRERSSLRQVVEDILREKAPVEAVGASEPG